MKKQECMGKRFVAGLIDIGMAAIVAAILMYVAASITGKELLSYAILFPVLLFFYMAVMDLANKGQTLGKMIMKEQVAGKNGKIPSAVDFVVRDMVKTMPILIIVLFPSIWMITIVIAGVYLIVPFMNNKGYAIHDIVGATKVNSIRQEEKAENKVEDIKAEVKTEEKAVVEEQEASREESSEQEVREYKPKTVPGIYGVSGMYEGAFIPLTKKITLGRSNTCNLVFKEDAPQISRRHCSVAYNEADATYILTDLESSFGTFLEDGLKIPTGKAVLLKEGETFSIGMNEQFKMGIKS